jgi:hypothetical protein
MSDPSRRGIGRTTSTTTEPVEHVAARVAAQFPELAADDVEQLVRGDYGPLAPPTFPAPRIERDPSPGPARVRFRA